MPTATRILDANTEHVRSDRLVLRPGVGLKEGLVRYAEVGTEMASQAGYTMSANKPVIVWDLQRETRFDGPKLLHDHEVRNRVHALPNSSIYLVAEASR